MSNERRRGGRPKLPDEDRLVRFTIRARPEVLAAVEQIAAEEGTVRMEALRQLLIEGLRARGVDLTETSTAA